MPIEAFKSIVSPDGDVVLNVRDPAAQDLLWARALRLLSVDRDAGKALACALREAGYVPPENGLIDDLRAYCERTGRLGAVLEGLGPAAMAFALDAASGHLRGRDGALAARCVAVATLLDQCVAAAAVPVLEGGGDTNDWRVIAAVLRDALSSAPEPKRPEVVCLCGSTRFREAFDRANYEFTLAGKVVLSVGFAPGPEHGEGVGCTPEQKRALDELHKRKIDVADRVFVLNVGGYVGESTCSEIAYARTQRKPVDYLEPLTPGSSIATSQECGR